MAARRYKSLHHNLQEGENVVFHREHTAKKNRHRHVKKSIVYLRWKAEKKYGKLAKYFRYR